MPGDYTRRTFDPGKDGAGVYQQQGRVTLDADFNELVDLFDRRMRVTTDDIFGANSRQATDVIRRVIVPAETPDGFALTPTPDGKSFTIGSGRAYVDGILVDNHGGGPRAFDGVTEEVRGSGAIHYQSQPYLSAPPLPPGGTSLVYLDVWHRERTWAEDPTLLDPALYGIDTATRRQTVWQVKLLPNVDDHVTCATPDADIHGWPELLAPTPSRLSTADAGVPAADDPCDVPAIGGYRGAENRLYRVQVHVGGKSGIARFVWSRDNASIASPVRAISGDTVSVARIGRDKVARFNAGDWVEVIDEDHELNGRAGELALVKSVDDALGVITLTAPLVGTFPADPTKTATRVRKWDQRLDAQGAPLQSSGPSRGSLVIDGSPVVLEDGVQVTFSLDGGLDYRVGDYWIFAARTADASVEELTEAPPLGPHHHRARLGTIVVANGTVKKGRDCRVMWPPDGDGCECDACVTPESHENGTLTIQAAVERVAPTGGVVCLAAGVYRLDGSVTISGARSLRIHGKGAATVVMTPGASPAFRIETCAQVTIEDLTVVGVPSIAPTPSNPAVGPSASNRGGGLGGGTAIWAQNVIGLTVQRCVLTTAPGGREDESPTLGLSGFIVGCDIRDNAILGTVGIGYPDADTTGLLMLRCNLADNVVVAGRSALRFSGAVIHVADVRIHNNSLAALGTGIETTGMGLPTSTTDIRGNLVVTPGRGIVTGVDLTRIEGNDVVGPQAFAKAGDGASGPFAVAGRAAFAEFAARAVSAVEPAGIVLTAGFGSEAPSPSPLDGCRCRVGDNRVRGVGGPGIDVDTTLGALALDDNLIERVQVAGIRIDGGTGGHATISRNRVVGVTGPDDDERVQLVAGVALTGLRHAAVTDNTILGIDHPGARLVAGIVLDRVGEATVSGNRVAGEPLVLDKFGGGVVVAGPFRSVTVSENELRLLPGGERNQGTWIAVLFDLDYRRLPTSRSVIPRRDDGTLLEGDRGLAAVHGNTAEASGPGPLLHATVAGPLTISDNRWLLAAGGEGEPVVKAVAPSAIVASNYLKSDGVRPALDLTADFYTVLGNIASGFVQVSDAYTVNNVALLGPWDALNVTTP